MKKNILVILSMMCCLLLCSACSESPATTYGFNLNADRVRLGIQEVDSTWKISRAEGASEIVCLTNEELPGLFKRVICYDEAGLYLDEDTYKTGEMVYLEVEEHESLDEDDDEMNPTEVEPSEPEEAEEYLKVFYYYTSTPEGLQLKVIEIHTNQNGDERPVSIMEASSILGSWGIDVPKVLEDRESE